MLFSVREGQTSNVGTTNVTVEPPNPKVEEAVKFLATDRPELLKPLEKIKTDLDKDVYGEFSSSEPNTVALNVRKIEETVRTLLQGRPEEEINKEIVNQCALTISHESGHQHAYTNTENTSEAPAEQVEQQVRQDIETKQSSIQLSFRKIAQMTTPVFRPSDIIYTAVLLDPESKQLLKSKYPGEHKNKFGEHVTLQFGLRELPTNLGQKVEMQVFGHGRDENGEAVSVQLFGVESRNEVPHITISTAPGVPPKYSQELLAKGHEAIDPFKLSGTVAAFTRSGWIKELPKPPEQALQNPATRPTTPF